MKLDIEHMKGMLDVFLESDRPFITLDDLAKVGYSIESDKTLFHYQLMIDEELISNMNLERKTQGKLGISISPQTARAINTGARIRLTNVGHEFAESLNSKNVFERLTEIGEQPMSVLRDVGIELLKSYAKKKFGLE